MEKVLTTCVFPKWETVVLKDHLEQLAHHPDNTMFKGIEDISDDGEGDMPESNHMSWKYLHFQWDWLNAVWGADLKKILERQCYKDIWNAIVEGIGVGKKTFVVLGDPGIGKSGMLIWTLEKLMRSHRKIVLQGKGGFQNRFTYCSSEMYEVEYGDFRGELQRDSALYFLVDGGLPRPPPVAGFTIVYCSPESKNYYEVLKDGRGSGALALYMPVWSFSEILIAQQENFARNWDWVMSRYHLWGGIPRYVLEKVNSDRLMTRAIFNFSDIAAVVEAAHPSHAIMHMQVAEGYGKYRYKFASKTVREMVFRRFHEHHKSNLYSFLVPGIDPSINSFRGELLQLLVKEKLGGEYRVKQVFPDRLLGAETSKVIKKMRLFEYDGQMDKAKLPDKVEQLGFLFWPTGNQTSFDCCWVEDREDGRQVCAAQVTYSSEKDKHGIKHAGIRQLMETFGVRAEQIDFYLVTPAELFEDADHQFWAGAKDARLKAPHILNELNKVRQFVLAFPVE